MNDVHSRVTSSLLNVNPTANTAAATSRGFIFSRCNHATDPSTRMRLYCEQLQVCLVHLSSHDEFWGSSIAHHNPIFVALERLQHAYCRGPVLL